MTFRLSLRGRLLRSAAETSPAAFRRELVLSAEDRAKFGRRMQRWQKDDFAALDPAWQALAGRDIEPARHAPEHCARYLSGENSRRRNPFPHQPPLAACRRAWIERPRGHSKTSDMAVQIAWILLFASRRVEGLAAAADRDQAHLIHEAVERIARANPRLCESLLFRSQAIVNPRTGSRLQIISSDVQSSWGALPDFVICDELCHWEKPDLWYSLLSSAAKRPHCVLAVLTNAGLGRGWQWDVREAARTSDGWYFSALQGACAPWLSAEFLDEQRRLLPEPIYQRLWQNVWQHSDGGFVTLEEATACRDESLIPQQHGRPGQHYVAAVDYAEKHDRTVGVVTHREGRRIVVDRMDVAVPRPEAPVPIAWVEDWIAHVAARFPSVTFVVDEYQLLGTIQRFEHRYDLRRFEFQGGRGNHALALVLRRLLLQRDIAWYADCGRVDSPHGRDDLETELASLLLRQSASGRCRIDHLPDARHHDDRAFALGAACLHHLRNHPQEEWLATAPLPEMTGFAW